MSSNRSEPAGIPICIAGLSILLTGENASLMEMIHHRYRLYSATGDHLHTLRLQIVEPYFGSPEEKITISDIRLKITNQTYEGIIDFKRGASTLTLNGKHALDDLEYFLRIVYAYLGFESGGFLIHSAGVVREGRSYLFFGPSGCGKSTVASHSTHDHILNDDLVMLLPGNEHWNAFSTPFWNQGNGKDSQPASGPLAGMYRLIKDRQNFLERISTGEALADLIASIPVLSRSSTLAAGLLQRCSALLTQVPVYRLHFTPNDTFWDVVN
jgi:hypothetical protein